MIVQLENVYKAYSQGREPRLPAQDQCMLSHDISACAAT